LSRNNLLSVYQECNNMTNQRRRSNKFSPNRTSAHSRCSSVSDKIPREAQKENKVIQGHAIVIRDRKFSIDGDHHHLKARGKLDNLNKFRNH